ncbi:MAG TPA: hypothetical protein VGS28_04140 [Candidatus Saccharimonadales bacterium]|nr:hypothetical protein [Candidatus Saccharimonadales bacterium]
MQKQNKDTEAGNHLEILLVVIAFLAIFGFAGWRVYTARHKNTPSASSSSSVATKTATSTNPNAAPLSSGNSYSDLQGDMSNISNSLNQDSTNINNSTGAVNDHQLNVSD